MTVVSATCSLTVGRLSGPGLLARLGCLGTGSIDAETGGNVGGDTVFVGARSTPTAGIILSGKSLERIRKLSYNLCISFQLLALFLLSYAYQILNPYRSTMVWAGVTNDEVKRAFHGKFEQFVL
jgi:hypothetical protein